MTDLQVMSALALRPGSLEVLMQPQIQALKLSVPHSLMHQNVNDALQDTHA